jgi:anti-sigma-K factor RskA
MTCETVDELAAAYALGAVEPDEERSISEHLAGCREPHAEVREMLGAGAMVARGASPVTPSSALRERLMATVAATPQDQRAVRPAAPPLVDAADREAAQPWWRARWVPAMVGAVGVVAVLALGAWNVNLNQQVAERDAVIRAVASADAVHQVAGEAGTGLLIEADGEAIFVAEGLAELPQGSLYELWLIGPDGAPVAVGTLSDTEGVALVPLEQELGPATTFAVTIESERVEAPTTDPVLVASLEG